MSTRTIAILLATPMLCGCHFQINGVTPIAGSGNIVADERAVDDFTAISYGGSGEVSVSQGDTCSVVVHCDDNLLENVVTSVEGDKLSIRHTGNIRWTELRIEITTPNLESLSLSGSGSGNLSEFKTESLHVSLSGSGSVKVNNLTTESLKVDVSGSGSISGTGTANEVEVLVAGSGSASLGEINAAKVSSTLSGSGGIKVHATEKLDGVLSGSGSIVCSGNPQTTNLVDSGSGSIQLAN